jgi:hypothetical protein
MKYFYRYISNFLTRVAFGFLKKTICKNSLQDGMNLLKERNIGMAIIIALLALNFLYFFCSNVVTIQHTEPTVALLEFFGILTFPLTGLGIIFVYSELEETRKFNEAEVMLKLHSHFSQNPEIQEVYKTLKMRESKTSGVRVYIEDIDKIVNYITFFETLNSMIEKRILEPKVVYDLFGNRFFLAVYDDDIQDIDLVKTAKTYKGIFRLYNKIVQYRVAHLNKEEKDKEIANQQILKQKLIDKSIKENDDGYMFENLIDEKYI